MRNPRSPNTRRASPKAKRPKSKAENPPDKFTNTLQAFTAERRKNRLVDQPPANAPIPTDGNLRWVSTSGMEAYDTPSGNLESGDYAEEFDGSYISNVPAYTYVDATSSVPIAAHIATSKTDPTTATSQ